MRSNELCVHVRVYASSLERKQSCMQAVCDSRWCSHTTCHCSHPDRSLTLGVLADTACEILSGLGLPSVLDFVVARQQVHVRLSHMRVLAWLFLTHKVCSWDLESMR
jgi:hypothetical protein